MERLFIVILFIASNTLLASISINIANITIHSNYDLLNQGKISIDNSFVKKKNKTRI